jgi:hypothetical protein
MPCSHKRPPITSGNAGVERTLVEPAFEVEPPVGPTNAKIHTPPLAATVEESRERQPPRSFRGLPPSNGDGEEEKAPVGAEAAAELADVEGRAPRHAAEPIAHQNHEQPPATRFTRQPLTSCYLLDSTPRVRRTPVDPTPPEYGISFTQHVASHARQGCYIALREGPSTMQYVKVGRMHSAFDNGTGRWSCFATQPCAKGCALGRCASSCHALMCIDKQCTEAHHGVIAVRWVSLTLFWLQEVGDKCSA